MRLIDADKLKEELQKHHDFFIEAWEENGVDKIEIPIPDKSRMDEITNCIAMVVNAPTVDCTWIISGRRYGKKEEALKYLRPKGEWIKDKVAFYQGCSQCGVYVHARTYDGQVYLDGGELNYCPNCGAKMDGQEAEE